VTAPSEIETLEAQVVDAVSRLGSQSGSSRVVVVKRHVHRGSLGLDLEVQGETGPPRRLFAKTLRAQSSDRYDLDQQGLSHARLRPVPDPRTRMQREGAALARISEMVDQAGEPGWFRVGVAARLLDGRVLVLEHVDRPTLLQALTGRIDRRLAIEGCRNAGRWLRAFHGLDDLVHTTPRLTDAADREALLDRFVDRLRPTQGWSSRIDAAVARARAGLRSPALGIAHGNFGPHNMFVGEGGEIGVFDTQAAHREPIELDLAYFLTMLRFPDWRGSWPALRQRSDPGLEEAFLTGYGVDPDSGRQAIAPYEVLVLLDLWCSTLAATPARRGVRRVAQSARRRLRVSRIATAIRQVSRELEDHDR
jgi:hypothetical protein